MTFPIGRRVFVMVNTSMLGLNETEREEGYQAHPMIRNNWRCADRLQDTFAYPPSLYVDEEGVLRAAEAPPAPWDISVWTTPFAGELNGGDPGVASRTDGILLQAPRPQANTFEFQFSNTNWNSYCVEPFMTTGSSPRFVDFLEYEGKDTLFAGIPYFVRYFADSQESPSPGLIPDQGRFHPASETVLPIMNDGMFNTDTGPKYFYNHKFKYAVTDPTVPENVGNIEINPVYNFYLDTSPDYEPTIAELQIPSAMLPNYYMMEANYKYAPESLGFMPYTREVLAFQAVVAADYAIPKEIFSGTSPEDSNYPLQTSAGYYQYYSKKMETLQDNDILADTKTWYLDRFKNVAVLTPEINSGFFETYNEMVRNKGGPEGYGAGTAKTSDDLFAINTYPFYNEIIIPHAKQYYSSDDYFADIGSADGQFELGDLAAPGTDQFLTLLQLLAIWRHNSGDTGATGLSASADEPMRMTKWDQSATPANTVVEESTVVDVLFHLEDLLGGLENMAYGSAEGAFGDADEALANAVATLTHYYDYGSRDAGAGALSPSNTVFLRDGFADDLNPEDPESAHFFNWTDYGRGDILEAGCQRLLERSSTFNQIFKNSGGSYRTSEAIMYIVEKRVVPPGQTAVASDDPSTVVQTLFFGKDIVQNRAFESRKGVHYYDTQIQYGVRYQYDIKQVRLVFGNRYSYDASQTETIVNSLQTGQGRALGNALGLFAPEAPTRLITPSYTHIEAGKLHDFSPIVRAQGNGQMFPSIYTTFPFVPEGDEVPWAASNEQLGGTYVYNWNPGITNRKAASRGAFGFIGPHNAPEELDWVDFDMIMLKVELGGGYDGYDSGGLVPGLAPEDVIGAENEIYEGLGKVDPFAEIEEIEIENKLDLVDSLNRIAETLGAQIADEVEGWVENGGPIADILDVILTAGGARGEQGGWGGDQGGMFARNLEVGLQGLGVNTGQDQQQNQGLGMGSGISMQFEGLERDLDGFVDIEI